MDKVIGEADDESDKAAMRKEGTRSLDRYAAFKCIARPRKSHEFLTNFAL